VHRSDDRRFGSWPTAQAWTEELGMRMKKSQIFTTINKTKGQSQHAGIESQGNQVNNELKAMGKIKFSVEMLSQHFLYPIKNTEMKA
jgi:hypothetical protein